MGSELNLIVESLLYFLGQATLAYALFWAVLKSAKSPQTRYGFLLSTFFLISLLPIVNFLWLHSVQSPGEPMAGHEDIGSSVAFWVWVTGATLGLAQLMVAYLQLGKYKSTHRPEHFDRLQEIADHWRGRLGIQVPVQVACTELLSAPAVIGISKAIIFMPVSIASHLSLEQIETILVHELVHVRRWDFTINLLQSIIERLLFFHPVIWALSSQIRTEREHLCDDEVVRLIGDRVIYASALASIATIRNGASDRYAIAADQGGLHFRIRRMLRFETHDRADGWAITKIVTAIAAVFLISWSALRAEAMNNKGLETWPSVTHWAQMMSPGSPNSPAHTIPPTSNLMNAGSSAEMATVGQSQGNSANLGKPKKPGTNNSRHKVYAPKSKMVVLSTNRLREGTNKGKNQPTDSAPTTSPQPSPGHQVDATDTGALGGETGPPSEGPTTKLGGGSGGNLGGGSGGRAGGGLGGGRGGGIGGGRGGSLLL